MPEMYRHTQFGGLVVAISLAAIAIVAAAAGRAVLRPAALIPLAALMAAMVLFSSLTVVISDGLLLCYFGPGLIRKKIFLREIADVRAVRNRWYYGWGIRRMPHGWMFNVSGLDAVEIDLASGRRFRIGTDRPAELVEAIRQAASLNR
jgi:hypothetical protein